MDDPLLEESRAHLTALAREQNARAHLWEVLAQGVQALVDIAVKEAQAKAEKKGKLY